VDRKADYLRVEYGCSTPALESIFPGTLAIGHIVGLAYILGEPAVHESVGSTSKFLAPRRVLDLRLEEFFQAAP